MAQETIKMKKVAEIRLQLGASFRNSETIELVFVDGTNLFLPLAPAFVNELRRRKISATKYMRSAFIIPVEG